MKGSDRNSSATTKGSHRSSWSSSMCSVSLPPCRTQAANSAGSRKPGCLRAQGGMAGERKGGCSLQVLRGRDDGRCGSGAGDSAAEAVCVLR